jgi:2-methylisocitrate lyase-like PEP mutase family enzyme
MFESKLHGLWAALLTPFTDQGTVDWEALAGEAGYLDRAGVQGLCVGGYASETAGAHPEELGQICRTVVAACPNRPLLVNIYPDSSVEALELAEAVVSAGVAALHLEDQVFPKRCGHYDDKAIVPAGEMQQKLRAAREAAEGTDLVLIARTDALAVEGLDGGVVHLSHLADRTTMYERFYGLRERPFNLTSNPRYLLLTSKHLQSLLSISRSFIVMPN